MGRQETQGPQDFLPHSLEAERADAVPCTSQNHDKTNESVLKAFFKVYSSLETFIILVEHFTGGEFFTVLSLTLGYLLLHPGLYQ